MCDAGCDAGPLSSIVWANCLASGWFVHCYFLSCYFFPTCPLFLFPCYFFPTATLIESTELLLIFLIPVFLLGHYYFLSCYFFSYLKLLLSFLFLFSHLSTVTFFPVTFFQLLFSYLKLLLSFLWPFFLLLSFRAPAESQSHWPITV